MKKHGERAHSKYSASASSRWLNCSASVELSEGQPDNTNVWSLEGTKAHEGLENVVRAAIEAGAKEIAHVKFAPSFPREMQRHILRSANWLLEKKADHPSAEFLVETRVYLDFIHPEMFGTFDSAIIDHFGTLHIYDFKYGKHYVSPNGNLQMIFYAIGIAYKWKWNFKRVRLWIDQPRSPGYRGPMFWEIDVFELMKYVEIFKRGVDRVENKPELKEGEWCFFCKAKNICPKKADNKRKKVLAVFTAAGL